MRLNDSLQFVKGIGPKRAEQFSKCGLNSIQDLLELVPLRYITHEHGISIREIQEKQHVTIIGKIVSCSIHRGRRKRFVMSVSDGTGLVKGVWFNHISSIQNRFEDGMLIALSGTVAYFSGFQIIHPQIEILADENSNKSAQFIIPIYSIPEKLRNVKLSTPSLRRFVQTILDNIEILPTDDLLPNELREKHSFISLYDSYKKLHFPNTIEEANKASRRFKFTELFLLQLYLLLRKKKQESLGNGFSFPKLGKYFKNVLDNLPYQLTHSQKSALKEIRRDMKQKIPMNRMLQGDVGSGKTIVALLSILISIDNGYQAVFMAPTEILAEQHYLNIIEYTKVTDINTVLLTGRLKEKDKEERLSFIANGRCHIVVGTHAIIQKGVHFKNLAFIVIDEQHRFGVAQRFSLADKGNYPDTLVMTATPIPRTMALTVYGDLDLSTIKQMPSGRKMIKTGWRYFSESAKIESFVKSRLNKNEQVYIVFPLVDESEKLDLKSAVEAYEELKSSVYSNYRLALLHGKMKSTDKETVMHAFKKRNVDILVSTTVVEVGLDVPSATIMIIEHAERFGLSQLHQLRGRVGRSDKQSYCILKTDSSISAESKERIKTMCETTDGFKIAEKDLRIRGIGEMFGTRQSGFSDSKMLSLLGDYEILSLARKEAEMVLKTDPHLRNISYQRLRHVVLNELAPKYSLLHIA